jgi:hypothetical protein
MQKVERCGRMPVVDKLNEKGKLTPKDTSAPQRLGFKGAISVGLPVRGVGSCPRMQGCGMSCFLCDSGSTVVDLTQWKLKLQTLSVLA